MHLPLDEGYPQQEDPGRKHSKEEAPNLLDTDEAPNLLETLRSGGGS